MNGGLDHGLDVLGPGVERAAAGWEHLGRADVGDLLRQALRLVPDMPADPERRSDFFADGWSEEQAEAIEELNDRYPDDDALEAAFLRRLRDHPDEFAPARG